jgi:hypothetical protein
MSSACIIQVKQVVITKTGSTIQLPATNKLGITVKNTHLPVKRLSTLSRMGTSKIHKFTPSVSLEQANKWISEYGACDASIMFDNGCAVLYEQGKFLEFEDIRDEDDDSVASATSTKAAAVTDVDEADSHDYVYPQPETVEKFKLGADN